MNPRSSQGRILIVDDHEADRRFLQEVLREANYDILEAADGTEALEMAAELAPDLLLLDVMMPGGADGYAVCRSLRDDPDTEGIPVLMVSALSDDADRLRGLEAGATEYLVKPVEPDELRLRVRNLLRQRLQQRDLEAALRESERRQQLRDEWATYAVSELDDYLHRLELDDPVERRELDAARHLTSAMAGCRELSQRREDFAGSPCDLAVLAGDLALGGNGSLDTEELAGVVQGDGSLLKRILGHLTRISLTLTDDSSIPVGVRSQDGADGQMTVEIESKGSGIWHEAFDQLNRGTIVGQGLDCRSRLELSFAFCRQALDLMGGSIGVEAAPGEGLLFWFTLPVEETASPANVIPFTPASEVDFDNAVSR